MPESKDNELAEKELKTSMVLLKWALWFGGTKLALYVLLRQIAKMARD